MHKYGAVFQTKMPDTRPTQTINVKLLEKVLEQPSYQTFENPTIMWRPINLKFERNRGVRIPKRLKIGNVSLF